ncbi:alkaline shock response membrane anchor protein AmaP [Desulfuribacillus alkaliarsenatis]|uniref:Alkaline shock response membrane anchor protein AmaP n=1 Tax=Desulfuribacillus alkaliarsenatis TaxID=766136 RepID=A0A1E5G5H9_9FIRM|nr:alkaline shock response membrane anchor protein AmaP [Desulfuribacillus alkaliarsenatis]OEF98440.1 hypothetical protein BHF68_01835 [Desulfuribacillus alkaliarsenatis]
MNLLEKIVFFFYNLAIALLSIIFIIVSLKLIPIDAIGRYFTALYANSLQTMLSNALIGLVFFLVALRFMFSTFERYGAADRTSSRTINHSTDIGDVKISVEALEAMAARTGRQIEGVRELSAKVIPTEFGAKISMKVTLNPETNIPETTDKLQVEVKKYVETLSGVKIEKVLVVVKDVLQKSKTHRAPLR